MKTCWVCGEPIEDEEAQCLECLTELADSFMEEHRREVAFYEAHPEAGQGGAT